MHTTLAGLVKTVVSGLIFVLVTGSATAQDNPDQQPPLKHVSFATKAMPVEVAGELRKGFRPSAIFPATDHNLYYHLHWPEFIPHHVVSRDGGISELEYQLNNKAGQARAKTKLGELTLDELIEHPHSRVQGFIVVHKGKIAYEAYPGMRQTDNHIWMSTAKTIAGLLVGLLEEEGKIDVNKPVDSYLEEFRGSNWAGVRIIDILDMSNGLDSSETFPNMANQYHPVSHWQRLVLHGGKDLKPMNSRQAILAVDKEDFGPGEMFHYASMNTQVLGFLVQHIEGKLLSDIISERIWSKIGAEGDAMLGLNDSGGAGIFAMMSTRLRDKARYAMLYTPSWSKVSDERIISASLIETIQQGCRPEIYQRTKKAALEAGNWFFSEDNDVHCNSRQWDALYKDGDMFKSGSHGQGLYVSPARDLVIAYFSTSPLDWQDYARAVAKAVVPNP